MADFANYFHFVRPWWFLAVIPVLVLTAFLWVNQKNSHQWQQFISPHLLPYLLDNTQAKQKRWPIVGVLVLWLACIVALAGPAWEKIPQPVEQNVSALVICWDLSPSMLAEDVKPSRLVRSRLKIIDLLQNREEGQVALIAYSGEAYTVTPLTDDIQTIINLLPALSPTALPTVGSNPEMALERAQQLLKDSGILKGDILFVTDEIDSAAFAYFEDELSSSSNQVSFWAVGTTEGAPIPLPTGGFAKANGNMVVAKLNEQELLGLAQKVGAYYIPMQTLDSDIENLTKLMDASLDSQTQKTQRVFDQWFEHGQYLALLFLPFMAYLFRRGWIFGFVLCAILPMTTPENAYAMQWDDLWKTPDQQAQESLEAGEEDAAHLFTSHERRGAALYKQGKFEGALKEFSQGDTASDYYNKGNTLTQSGQFEDAIASYDEALKLNPDYTKASENRDIAKQLAELSEQQEQDGESQDGEKKDQEQQKNDQNSEQQQQGDQSQQQDSENKDSQQQDSENQDGQQQPSSDQQSDEAQAQQKQDEQEPKEEDNPYSQESVDQQEAEDEKEQEEKQAEAQSEENERTAEEEQLSEAQAKAIAQAMQMSDEEKEEKQKLEQWLRKVPDDPSGLMRNKFKYEYNKRRQEVQTPAPYSNDDPEERW